MKENSNDTLLWFFTSLVALFPAIVLTALLLFFYYVLSLALSKNILIKTENKKGLIYVFIAGIFAVLSVIVCLKWEYWSSINMLIPYVITGFLFNKKAKKYNVKSIYTNINMGMILAAVFIALISIIFK
jgi:hypothetical protein